MNVELSAAALWADIEKIRQTSPVVHNITNFVVMNTTANALLALGASPVMAHAVEEVEDMTRLASSLVINIGTLSSEWVKAMKLAMQAAAEMNRPVVLDPVGAGATAYRTRISQDFLKQYRPTVLRGNISEIMALSDMGGETRGVDSSVSDMPVTEVMALAQTKNMVVAVSGETDLVTDGRRCAHIRNGHAMMPKVTGLGCTATAIVGAFVAIQADPFLAAAHAMATMGICGELAADKAAGPGSLQMHLLDSLHSLDEGLISAMLRR